MGDLASYSEAVVVLANRFQFEAGETLVAPRVQSRMLLWRLGGAGRVRVNGRDYGLEGERYLFLPWNHRIRYEAARRDPFELAGVHLIPRYGCADAEICLDLAHRRESPLSDVPERGDLAVGGRRGVSVGDFAREPALRLLAGYVVELFAQRREAPTLCRRLGGLLLAELARPAGPGAAAQGASARPEDLQRLLQYIGNHLDRPIGMAQLVAFSELSASTIGRLFRSGLGLTPMEYVARERLGRACRLLHGSRLKVSTVAERCGFEDPYYFSKWFKQHQGVSPLQYRRQRTLF